MPEFSFNPKIDTEVLKQSKLKFEQKLPQSSVFHYTSVGGMQGILGGKTLHFTNIRYMNDKEEIITGINRVKQLFDFCEESPENLLSLDCLQDGLDEQYFVCCFSTEMDSLPMWNYYTKEINSQGYNIKFQSEKLITSILTYNEALNGCKFSCGTVQYSRNIDNNKNYRGIIKTDFELELAQVLLMIKNIRVIGLKGEEAKEQQKKMEHLSSAIENAKKNLKREIFQTYHYNRKNNMIQKHCFDSSVAFIKKEWFRQEKEFRLVITVPNELLPSLKEKGVYRFRTQNGVLVPYLQLNFSDDAVQGITISPTVQSDLVEVSIKDFLDYCGFYVKNPNTFIKHSEIPVRF